MSLRHTLLGAALAASVGAAHADGLRPLAGRSIDLGGVSGIAYYTVERDGFHVVATLSQGQDGTPLRIVAVLGPGQRLVLSTPQATGTAPRTIVISRHGDEVLVGTAATN